MRHRSIAIAVAVSSLFSALIGVTSVSAEVSIAVAPAILDLTGPVGGNGTVEIIVDNEGDAAFDIVSSILDLETAAGLPSATRWSGASPQRLHLEPGTSGAVRFSIDIPDDAAPGGHYTAVSMTAATPADDSSPTGLAGRIVVPVLIAVTGDEDDPSPVSEPILERAALFLERSGDLLARAEVRNDGNVHVPLVGTVDVAPVGEDVVETISLPVGRVLPEKTRLYPAADRITLESGAAYDAMITLAVPARGRVVHEPLIDEMFEFENTADLRLDGLSVCDDPAGGLNVGVTLVNAGTLGIAPDLSLWAEIPGRGRAAVAQPIRPPLAWPGEDLDVVATMNTELQDGEYVLVAEAAYGPTETARTELPVRIGSDTDPIPMCVPEAGQLSG